MSNHIKKFTQEQKDAAKLGAEGGLGLVAGTLGRIGKAFGNTAKQYFNLARGKKPAIYQQTASNIKPFRREHIKPNINDAFKKRFSKVVNNEKKKIK